MICADQTRDFCRMRTKINVELFTHASETEAVSGMARNTPKLWMVPTNVRFHS